MAYNILHKNHVAVIVCVFLLCVFGCVWVAEQKDETSRKEDEKGSQTTFSLYDIESEPHQVSTYSEAECTSVGYYYSIDIENAYDDGEEVIRVVGWDGDEVMIRKQIDSPDLCGHFEWYCDERLTSMRQMYDYFALHHEDILNQVDEVHERIMQSVTDDASYYQNHYDEYLEDPEDELRFPPEIFDANDDW